MRVTGTSRATWPGPASPLGLELRVLGLKENVEMSHQPEEGEDAAAAPTDRGVERDHPHVGLRPRTPAEDRHVLRPHLLALQLGVGGRGDVWVGRGGRGGTAGGRPGGGGRGPVGHRDHGDWRPLAGPSRHLTFLETCQHIYQGGFLWINKRKEVCKPLNQQDPLVEITAGSVLMINLASLTSQHEAVTVSHCTDVICLFSVPNLFSITEDDMIVQVP